jgi:hypothetical protein
MHTRFRALPTACALVVSLLVGGSSSFAQDKKGAPKIDKAYQAEITAATKIIDDAIKGQAAPTDYKFTFTNHSMKSRDAKTYVPFILTFDKGQTFPTPAAYYVRVVSRENLAAAEKANADHEAKVLKAAMAAKLDPENVELAEEEDRIRAEAPKVEYAFEDFKTVNFNKPNPNSLFMLPSAMAVAPGTYDAYVLVKETAASVKGKKVPAKAGLLKVALTVPNYEIGDLATSSIVLTKTVQQLKAAPTDADLARNPYIFGAMAVMPSLDFKFTKADELTILFYVYNGGLDKTTGKPDLTIDYNFYQKVDGAEKFFNKTPTLSLNATTLPPTFDVKAGHQLNGGQGLPLASFPEGEYRVEIKIVDKATGKTKTQSCSFTVTAG